MLREKKWKVLREFKSQNVKVRNEDIISILLENRNISEEERGLFLSPDLAVVTPEFVGIDTEQLQRTISRIQQAIEKKEQIVIFGDYDVEGVTATAILWETLHSLGANVLQYIHHKV